MDKIYVLDRNCGPGYIIRKVVQDTIPDNLLDKEL